MVIIKKAIAQFDKIADIVPEKNSRTNSGIRFNKRL
jgi:hypothetical protein